MKIVRWLPSSLIRHSGTSIMQKIRKGDDVVVTTGKDVASARSGPHPRRRERVVVEGINRVKKHTKPNPMKGDQGGIVEKEMPINISNVALFNPATQKADRVGFKTARRRPQGRVFKSNGEVVDAGIQKWLACRNFTKRRLCRAPHEVRLQVDHGGPAHHQDHPQHGGR